MFEQSLYAVTTGRNPDSAQKPGTIQQILGNQDYENLKFDLSPDGKAIAIQRANRSNVEDIGLWVLRPESAPTAQKLLNRPAGEFAIAQSSLMLLNLQQTPQSNVYPSPQPLSLQGFRPQWLP